jgi:hypothetical protein
MGKIVLVHIVEVRPRFSEDESIGLVDARRRHRERVTLFKAGGMKIASAKGVV